MSRAWWGCGRLEGGQGRCGGMYCGGGVTRGSGSVERKEAGRGAAALEREIYLFKEQGSIFFLSWNGYNAPIFIVPIGLAYQTIYQGVLIDLDSSFLYKYLPIICTLFLNIFIFLNYLELGTRRRWRGAAPLAAPSCAARRRLAAWAADMSRAATGPLGPLWGTPFGSMTCID